MPNQPRIQAAQHEQCHDSSYRDSSWVTDMVGGSVADSYFFSELCTRYGECKAIDFRIASTEQSTRATRRESTSSMGSPSSGSRPSSIGSALSGSRTGSRASYASISPSILNSSMSDRPRPFSTGSTSAASGRSCATCRSAAGSSSETQGRDSFESFETMRHTLGARAGLLYTDAAHLVMDEGDEMRRNSL